MFWKKKIAIYAPISGTVVPLKEVPDEVFASGMMGQGIGIEPNEDTIYAPADVTIVSANQGMRHALGLQLKNGVEVLIHVGIDTVSLNNQGFEFLVNEGQEVKLGSPVLKFNPETIEGANLKKTVMVIVTDLKGANLEIQDGPRSVTAILEQVMLVK